MTRIAAGTAGPNQPFVNTSPAHAQAAPTAATAGSTASAVPRTVTGDVGPDRPTPPSTGLQPHATIDAHAFYADLLRWENDKPFMYADTRGFVTTGIGNKLANAQQAIALPWLHSRTGQPATPAEVLAAFERVRARYAELRRDDPEAKKSAGAGYYEQTSDLVLPPGATSALAIGRLERDFLPGLRRLFPAFDAYPLPAQRALVDMIYTLGESGLKTKFPTVVTACRDGNFAKAAAYCHRRAQPNEHRQGDERNIWTRNMFLEAARLTVSVQTLPREVRP
jgi:GH24 family phage-related lysozyme (muramidase)